MRFCCFTTLELKFILYPISSKHFVKKLENKQVWLLDCTVPLKKWKCSVSTISARMSWDSRLIAVESFQFKLFKRAEDIFWKRHGTESYRTYSYKHQKEFQSLEPFGLRDNKPYKITITCCIRASVILVLVRAVTSIFP